MIDFEKMEAKVSLTDEEWMSLIDADRGGLERCCGNISNLSDVVIQIARDGGLIFPWASSFIEKWNSAIDGHDSLEESPALVKIRDACQLSLRDRE